MPRLVAADPAPLNLRDDVPASSVWGLGFELGFRVVRVTSYKT